MRSVRWNAQVSAVEVIDQRRLPGALEVLVLRTVEEVAAAIADMTVRGAPAIGAAAAFGLALAAGGPEAGEADADLLWARLTHAASHLGQARPTAVNLRWALERVLSAGLAAKGRGPEAMRQAVITAAERLAEEDIEGNRRIGLHGADLIHDGDTVIHHCNTGALATVDFGTALGIIRTAHEQGKRVRVLVDETRPRLQGARLTAWELSQYGIPHEIITDGAAGHFLRRGEAASVFVGADRVAANGDVANKVGTYMLALAAHDNAVPFYCAAPTSTIDLRIPNGEAIPIEERDPAEILCLQYEGQAISPPGSRARNPAFDITPCRLVSAFVTERGVLRQPFGPALAQAVEEASAPWASS